MAGEYLFARYGFRVVSRNGVLRSGLAYMSPERGICLTIARTQVLQPTVPGRLEWSEVHLEFSRLYGIAVYASTITHFLGQEALILTSCNIWEWTVEMPGPTRE